MRAEALETLVQEDIAAGMQACAVVANTGTTATTAIDPVGAIAAVVRRYGLWLHVDAAMAGSAMILRSAAGCGAASKQLTALC